MNVNATKNDDENKATKLETLGAWLGLWTPPRGVAVAPIPWRKVVLVAAALAFVAVATALTIAPAIDDAKNEGNEQRQRELDQRAAARRARLAKMQEPRFGTIPVAGEREAGGSARSADGAEGRRARALSAVGDAIGRDARERFSPKARQATCVVAPGVDADAANVAYNCFSATTAVEGAGDQDGARGSLGYPYRAVIDFSRRRYAFCRTNPQPSEKALADPRKVAGLPSECLLQRG
ncbi:MAG: hypothetical protein AVDCRST_MAG85-4328 [uncultured Solirubrobacteraceae bacterium]|uniref:Uncharacterized protein n=1 Tax=uncultured Solirubrobacteraceae bacterium TaxID=1162706 RepID=A0A6J4U1G8_9ACTN|nr:MAG: hypothetical protein AVDCRST_MAG85-4328 [uncultured Solirubrobacteraceae bacterium]